MRRHHSRLILTLASAVFASLLVLAPSEGQAQISLDALGKVGATSVTISDTSRGDPIFDIGGGAQIAAALKFVGGIAAGLNFNLQYDSHRMSGTTSGRADSFSIFAPSIGVYGRFELMPSINATAWINYVFGSASAESANAETNFALQGFEFGASAQLAYQMKPYKTYILAGLYAYYEYLSLFVDENGLNYAGDVSAPQIIGIGAQLGVRFDFSL